MGEGRGLRIIGTVVFLIFAFAVMRVHSRAQQSGHGSSRIAFSHALPPLNGEKLTANVVEVSYGPGESSPAHSHPCPVIAYVLEGEIRSQVEGQPEAVYKAGESFYEAPNGVHQVSANASRSKPARLLAIFVCDRTAPLSAPAGPRK